MANIPQFLQKDRIKANVLITDTINYLVKIYKQSIDAFTYSTSFGQILLVTQNLFQLVMFYVQDSITEMNIHTAKRPQNIYGLSRLTGHNPGRGTSATGEISLTKKADSKKIITGNKVFISNYTRIKCINNGLFYLLNLGADDIVIDINKPNANIRIIEGETDAQLFQGTGEDGQTFEVTAPVGKMIEDNFSIVTVNGTKYDVYDSLYDIPFKAKGVLLKTGITSGIDLIFGNQINTSVPLLGETIRVDYLITNGSRGNIFDRTNLQFEFVDSGLDINAEEVNLNEILEIAVNLPPDFGADPEPPELTRNLAPNISRNFIIHDERSLRYFLARMNYFSTIKIFKTILDNNNLFNTLLLPDINTRLNPGEDYFNVATSKFLLSEIEKTRLINSIDESGRKSGNISINPIDPKVRKAALILIIEVFDRINGFVIKEDTVRNDIRSKLSEYGLSNKRINKIPHSDIVRIIDEIDYIDTVKAIFVPQFAEDIDTQGNLSVDEKSIILLRGGFKDAEGVSYEDDFDPIGEPLGSVNLDIRFVPNIQ